MRAFPRPFAALLAAAVFALLWVPTLAMPAPAPTATASLA